MTSSAQTALHLAWSCCCLEVEELQLVLLLGQLVQESKLGCMTVGPVLDSLITGTNYSCFSVRPECLTLENIKLILQ